MRPLHFAPMDTAPFAADCARCRALCCTELYFAKTDGFPYDKPSGTRCRNLENNDGCRIHGQLREKGFKGCLAYDCLGAGPAATALGAGFEMLCLLYTMRWYLAEALMLSPLRPLALELRDAHAATCALCLSPPNDVKAHQAYVNRSLKKSCAMIQQAVGVPVRHGPSDCFGQRFAGQDLSGRDWSMSLLVAADLSGCTLYGVNFLGADVRDTAVYGADLRESVYLTQAQVNAMRGDSATRLPAHLQRPGSWRQ